MALEVLSPWSWMVTTLVLLVTVRFALKFHNQAKGSAKGNVSLSFIGDTVQFLRRGPRDFLQDCLARNGDPFTISVMGTKYTVVNSPEAIRFVLSTAHAAFSEGMSKQFKQVLGEGKLAKSPGHIHFRKAILAHVTGDGLLNLFPFIYSSAEKTVKSWENQAVVNTFEEMTKFTFTVLMRIVWRDVEADSEEMAQIKNDFSTVLRGISVLPINFPGFVFYKALKARQALVSRILETISNRRETGSEVNDLMNALINMTEVEVSDYDICCIVFSMMFAGHVTTSALLSWVVKYLHDFPEVCQRVQDEQDSVRQKMIEDESLTWFKHKSSMPYTLQVINEVLRLEALAPYVPRQVKTDVDYNGFVFRKGSYVLASVSSIQLNPDYYPDPMKFDPSRFEAKPKPNTFMPFGRGPHLCTGSDLAMTEALFMVHHLITNFSWERFGPDQKSGRPLVIRRPAGGFPIVVKSRQACEAE